MKFSYSNTSLEDMFHLYPPLSTFIHLWHLTKGLSLCSSKAASTCRRSFIRSHSTCFATCHGVLPAKAAGTGSKASWQPTASKASSAWFGAPPVVPKRREITMISAAKKRIGPTEKVDFVHKTWEMLSKNAGLSINFDQNRWNEQPKQSKQALFLSVWPIHGPYPRSESSPVSTQCSPHGTLICWICWIRWSQRRARIFSLPTSCGKSSSCPR